jgi:hypothetical protein
MAIVAISLSDLPLEAFAWFLVVRVVTPEERMCDD